MTRTSSATLAVLALIGGAVGWLLEMALVATGAPAAIPPATFAFALAVVGILVIALAIPVRKTVRDRQNNRVDPFYATRVVLLAKASSLTGALISGAALGILAFLLTRSVVAAVGSILMTGLTVIGAVVLVVGGLVAENWCSIPPDDTDEQDNGPAMARPH